MYGLLRVLSSLTPTIQVALSAELWAICDINLVLRTKNKNGIFLPKYLQHKIHNARKETNFCPLLCYDKLIILTLFYWF